MKTTSLEKLTDEQLSEQFAAMRKEMQRRIAKDEKRIHDRRKLLGQESQQSNDHAPRRRRPEQTETHKAISRAAQKLRRAVERKDKKEIASWKTTKVNLQKQLAREKADKQKTA